MAKYEHRHKSSLSGRTNPAVFILMHTLMCDPSTPYDTVEKYIKDEDGNHVEDENGEKLVEEWGKTSDILAAGLQRILYGANAPYDEQDVDDQAGEATA